MEIPILQLAPYVLVAFLSALLVYFRLHKRYKKDPVATKWDYIDRNPVEMVFIIILLAVATVIVPGVPELLQALLS